MNLLNKSWLSSLALGSVLLSLSLLVHIINMNGDEGLVSTTRIFLSILIWPIILKNIKIKTLIKFIFFFSLFNSSIVCLQFYDSIFVEIIPDFLKYGYFYGFDSIEPFRNGGIVSGLQVSSILALISMFIGIKYKMKYSLIWLSINLFAILTGSRTVLLLSTFLLLFFIKKNPFKSIIIIGIFFQIVVSTNSFDTYLRERILPAFQVALTFDASKDYSAEDTMSQYKLPSSATELLIGNGYPRYSNFGGGDPFISRWLMQSGLIVTASLLLLLTVMFYPIIKADLRLGLLFLFIVIITSVKGELITSFGVFDVLVIFRFIIFPQLIHPPKEIKF